VGTTDALSSKTIMQQRIDRGVEWTATGKVI
jgi:hypothetical protein